MDHSEHPGVPQRPPASAQLSINSIDRYANALYPVAQYYPLLATTAGQPTASDFQMLLQRPLLSGYFTRLAVSQVQLQWNIYTITAGVNDVITITDVSNNQTFSVTLTEGFYNFYSLAAQIQAQVIAQATTPMPAFTCTFNPVTQAYTFATNEVGRTIRIVSTGQPSNVLKLYVMLGISRINEFVPLATQIGGVARLCYTSYIDIISRKLTQYMRVKDSETSFQPDTAVLCRVYMTPPNQRSVQDASGNLVGSQPFTLVWDPNTPKHIKWEPNQYIYDFDIQVKDEFGDLLPWSAKRNFEFQMTMLASET